MNWRNYEKFNKLKTDHKLNKMIESDKINKAVSYLSSCCKSEYWVFNRFRFHSYVPYQCLKNTDFRFKNRVIWMSCEIDNKQVSGEKSVKKSHPLIKHLQNSIQLYRCNDRLSFRVSKFRETKKTKIGRKPLNWEFTRFSHLQLLEFSSAGCV